MRPPGRRSRPVLAGWPNSSRKTRRKPPEPKVNVVDIWKPSATVAAVVERDGRFLFVEGRADGRSALHPPRPPRPRRVADRGVPARSARGDGAPLRAYRAHRHLSLALRGAERAVPAILLPRPHRGRRRAAARPRDRRASLALARGAPRAAGAAPLAACPALRRRLSRGT